MEGFRKSSHIFIVIIKHIASYSLAKPVSKVKILVRPWPDLPGWFPQPCMYTMYGYTNIVQTKASVKLRVNLTLAGYLLYLGIKYVK